MSHDHDLLHVGAIAMGSHTYEWIRGHTDGTWEYAQPCWVSTTRDLVAGDGGVRFTRADVGAVHAELLAAADGRDVWVCGGGELAGRFADAGLLDEVWVQYAPVTLGAGAPVLPRRLDLTVLEVARNRDFTCARYAVGRVGESAA